MKPSIEAWDLCKSYGSQKAVDGLDLEIMPGEIYGLLGPNGAGKTTTLKLLGGLLAPDRGRIRIAGIDLAVAPLKAKEQLGYIPDNPYLYDSLTGREFLGLVAGLYRLGVDDLRIRTEELAELLEAGSWLDQRAEGYSHGMRQKLVLAAALLHRPAVLLIDEPLVGLDPAAIRTVREIFRRQAHNGTALLISTHTLSLAEAICSRIGIISRGRLVVQGSLEELRSLSREKHTDLERLYLEFTRPVSDI